MIPQDQGKSMQVAPDDSISTLTVSKAELKEHGFGPEGANGS